MHPDDNHKIWLIVKDLDFDTAFGAFEGTDICTVENEHERKTDGVRGRLLESCKIYTRGMGWDDHAFFQEVLKG